MKKNRILTILLALCLMASLLAGCGGSSASQSDNAIAETWAGTEAMESGLTSSTDLNDTVAQGRKLIRRVSIDAETKAFDDLMTGLTEKITELGGYIESREADSGSSYYYSSRYNRHCSMVIRIPADLLDEFIAHVNENANVTYTSETTEDITLEYVDTEARVEALETERERLLDLLEGAETLTDILEIEERLSEVSYQLESYASRMRTYDNLVDYATVNLSISEVQELTPTEEPTVWERISEGFSDSLSDIAEGAVDLFVWFIAKLPKLIIWAAVISGVVIMANSIKKKHKNKKDPSPPADSE